ncbi:hypothetical protein L226DRAFT_535391 [Lentinus tigrinus ALCF2SS1-7]|uniref:Uncharacterized protein n=1 Tax=Lentinus tigrinus ALCF2SS1-6 TaxID=1328759 RepID=A0A5C2SFE7_9APHY|nr:hypothetical protein L227DRAFT_573887 [Lentinus tigrinus ALCF2SS1-6]RPD74514.1 hypothetical protein L226DRAFT_535391 [Lentinus tigrinus ALCF2SS1-7]
MVAASALYVFPATTSDDSRTMIAEPPYRLSRSYAGYIDPQDVNDWVAVKILIRDILPMKLDLKLSWSQQELSRKRDLVSTVLSSYPAFKKYEANWPVLYYCYQHLGKSRLYRGEGAKNRPNNSTTSGICHRVNIRRSQSVLSTATAMTLDRISPVPTAASTSAPSSDVSPRYAQMMRGEEEVTTFLQSIGGTFDSSKFLDRFVTAGVNSGARLKDVAKWGVVDRDMFLRCEVRLNAFECKLVSDALQRMVSDTQE